MTVPPERLTAALADRYTMERELGAGGMATVYLAHDVRHDRKVAIKVLRPELSAVLGAERFVQEIRTTANLQHPHILPLFDSGEADSFLYYVMPYVEGETLRQKLERESQLAVDDAVRIAASVGDALDYAHRNGVIHRDIKPENILLQEGQPVVADFGIALALQQAAGARITETGLSLGTPAYMSPEQATADRTITARSDIYSLGSVLYEMLVGDPPFAGTNVRAMIARIVSEIPTSVTTIRPTVPRWISAAVDRALAKVPGDRFDTAAAFVAAFSSDDGRGSGASSIAVLPFANMSTDPENEFLADGISEEIINALTKLPGLRVVARTSAFAFKGKHEDLRSVGNQLGVDHVLEGSLRRAGNRLRIAAQLIDTADGYHLWSERYDRQMDDVFAVQDEISQAIVETLKVQLTGTPDEQLVKPATENLDAYSAYLKGLYFWNRRGSDLLRALEQFDTAVETDPTFARAYAALADTHNLLGFYRMTPPSDGFSLAKAAAAKALALDDTLAEAHTSLGFALTYYDWDWDEAERAFRRASDLNPTYPTNHHWYGEYLMLRGRLHEAIAEAERARDLDPIGLILNVMVGWANYYARRYDRAIHTLQGTVDMDPRFAPAYIWLAPSYLLDGDVEKAMAACRREEELSGTAGSLTRHIRAVALSRLGETAEANSIIAELENRATDGLGFTWECALVHAGLGNDDEALSWLTRACDERSPFVVSLAVEPLFESLRPNARFRQLAERIGLGNVIASGTPSL